jgi:hypothetical protein
MSYEITRKDRMAVNIKHLQERHENFDFIPETFVLPEQYGEFVQSFNKIRIQQKSSQDKNLWICKPTNKSCGRGIYIVDDVSEV